MLSLTKGTGLIWRSTRQVKKNTMTYGVISLLISGLNFM